MSKATPTEAYLSPDFQFEFHQTNVWMTRLRFCTTASERVYTAPIVPPMLEVNPLDAVAQFHLFRVGFDFHQMPVKSRPADTR